jgi:inner membrane protein
VDSLTQAVLGAVVGEVFLGRKIGWRGAVWGAAFGTLPDLDVVALPFLDEAAGIRWHRGLSHSLLIMVVAALALAKPLAGLHRERGVTAREMGWMIFWVWSTHVLIDGFTTFGTQIYEPFSNERVALNNLFIIDFLFTGPLIVGLWIALRLKPVAGKRKRVMWTAIGISSMYVVFSFSMKAWAHQAIGGRLHDDLPKGELVAVTPCPFNTVLWRGLIEVEDGYHVTYWSPFDDDGEAFYEYYPKKRELADKYRGEDLLEALQWFSRGHWVAREGEGGKMIFVDMRFVEIRDPTSGRCHPIFQWHMERTAEGVLTAPMMRPEDLDYPGAFGLIWQRMWGSRKKWDAVNTF